MPKHTTTLTAAPVACTGRRIVTAMAAAAAAVCIVIGWGTPVHAEDEWAASNAVLVPKSWIVNGNLDGEPGAANRLDYFMQAFSMGIVIGSDVESLEGQARAAGAFHRSRPAAVIALRPHTGQDHGPIALAIQTAPTPGRPCIDHAEGLMPLAMQVSEVRRIGFACMATGGGSTVRGECEAVPDGGARPGSGIDLATPLQFANDRQKWMLICRMTP